MLCQAGWAVRVVMGMSGRMMIRTGEGQGAVPVCVCVCAFGGVCWSGRASDHWRWEKDLEDAILQLTQVLAGLADAATSLAGVAEATREHARRTAAVMVERMAVEGLCV